MVENSPLMLICGATGFIGRNLLDYFSKQEKYRIRATHFARKPAFEHSNVEWIHCDLRDQKSVSELMKDVDVVLQFAATTTGAKDIVLKPYIHVTDNAVMNSILLRTAFENNIKHFIFPSCTIMYQKSESAVSESDFDPSAEILPFYFGAGNTKVYLEKMCEFYSRLGKTKHTVIRHSNLYGPYDKYDLEKSHVFGATVTKVMASNDGTVRVWGTGEEKRDLLYVEDFVALVDTALQKQESSYELVNAGLGEGIKIKDLVKKIVDNSGRNLEIVHDLSMPTVPTSLFLDCSKAKKIFGWSPSFSLDEGIRKTIEWYRKNVYQDEKINKTNDRKKDILLAIQSRSNPAGLRETIQMCLNTCASPDNFEISCFVDDDQLNLYQDIKSAPPQIHLHKAIEFFRENGYLVVNGIFSEEDADQCNRLIRRHANSDFAAIVNPDRHEELTRQDERPKSNITLEEIEETSNQFLTVMKNPRLVSMLETLSGKEMVGLSSQFIFKEAHSKYSNQAWNIHQDGWYPNDKNGEYITANWFLRSADVENGTIFVYPGSHKLGLLSASPEKSFREDYDKNPGSKCELPPDFEGKKVDVLIPKSGVVFLHGHCVHGSYPNKSNRSRPWHSCCYISKGSSYVVGENAKRKEISLK